MHNANFDLGIYYYSIDFQKIVVKNESETINFEDESCELNFDISTVLLSTEYRRYFQNIINDLIVEKKCLNDIFYYCKNEKKVKEELKKIILPIQFYSNELDYIF